MAQLLPATGKGASRVLHIDMTPMVDLGFLLITFFIFTATITEKKAVQLVMPNDGKPMDLSEKNVLTAILGKDDKVMVYTGRWEDALANNAIEVTNYGTSEGLGRLVRQKQVKMGANKEKLMLLVKPLSSSSYKNVIDALDEAMINDLSRYAIVDPTKEEKEWAEGKAAGF